MSTRQLSGVRVVHSAGAFARLEVMPCAYCASVAYCAADCGLAPWNDNKSPASRFVHVMRMRRWVGWPLDARDIFFAHGGSR